MARLGPFSFDWLDSPLRRRHPLAKLGALLALSLAASVGGADLLVVAGLLGVLALVLAGAFRRGFRPGILALLRDGRFLLPLCLVVTLFRVLEFGWPPRLRPGEFREAGLYALRLLAVFTLSEAFFRSTTQAEIAAALSALVRRGLGRKGLDPGLYLSLALGFIPRCFAAYAAAREAAEARGYAGGRGRVRFRALLALLGSFTARSLGAALATTEALEARDYDPARTLFTLPFRRADAVVLGAGIGVLCLGILL